MTIPVPGALDYVTAVLLAAAYAGAGVYGLWHSPRDVRARTFLTLALVNAVFAFLPLRGFDRATIVATVCVGAVGSAALFHFAMVFPWRQPWFRLHGRWMPFVYVTPLVVILLLSLYVPSTAEDLTLTDLVLVAAGALPLVILLAVLLPLAALIALYSNIRRARRQHVRAAYLPTVGIFISQLGGGILAGILGALLQTIGLGARAIAAVAVSVFAVNVIAPLAFAAGVGYYRVLSLDPDAV